MNKINWLTADKKTGKTLMDHLWDRFDGLYPNKFRAQFVDQQASNNWKTVWAECLADENITFDEVNKAIKTCRREIFWPPSFAEFYQACRPKINYEDEYIEAVRCLNLRRTGRDAGQWRSKAAYWTAASMSFDVLNQSYDKIKTQWIKKLDEKLADKDLPEIPEAAKYQLDQDYSVAKEKSSLAREKHMKSIRELLASSDNLHDLSTKSNNNDARSA